MAITLNEKMKRRREVSSPVAKICEKRTSRIAPSDGSKPSHASVRRMAACSSAHAYFDTEKRPSNTADIPATILRK